MNKSILAEFAYRGIDLLRQDDRVLYELLDQEYRRQNKVLGMITASSITDPSSRKKCEQAPDVKKRC